MTTDYVELMDKLRNGTLKEIKVSPDDFIEFRQAWTNYPERKEIVGAAERGGTIVYRYESQSA